MAHTRCRLLVTTRIRGLLTTLNMQSAGLSNLTESEGLDLIAKRVSDEERTVTVAELPEECKALISLVEGHTLAVSLIAARLTKHEGGLDYAPRLLSRLEKGKYFRTLQLNETDKNHNLELSLRLSYDDLGEDLQRRFRALGVLASDGTFDEALAMALWGDEDADDTDDALTDLVRKGLLRREDKNRYGQHGLLRAYALALLTEADERDDTFVRYADYVTAVARQFLILPPQEWSQLDDDIPFIQHVGDQLAEAFDTREEWQDLALRFAVNTKNYVFRRPEIHRLTWLEMGLAISKAQADQSREALFAGELGLYHDNRGEKQQALVYYQTCLRLRSLTDDKYNEATTLNNIGGVYSALGDKESALSYYEQALPIYREVGDRGGEARTLNNIGAVYRSLGNMKEALSYFEH
ncbi:MAG: tetratricopeptide repeat protein, partial [Chloroflexota bacterium]